MFNTDKLQNMAWDSEDAGADVDVFWHSPGVISYVVIDGEEFVNEYLYDELDTNDEREARAYYND